MNGNALQPAAFVPRTPRSRQRVAKPRRLRSTVSTTVARQRTGSTPWRPSARTAVHQMGLVTLTHTPNPMGFLSELLGRPANEKAMLVMPVGYPADGAKVPDLSRKGLDEIAVWK